MSSGAFEDMTLESSASRARSRSQAGVGSDSDFLRTTPRRGTSGKSAAAPYAGEGGLLEDFDDEFSREALTFQKNANFGNLGGPDQPITPVSESGRQQEQQKMLADQERVRQQTPYLHAGKQVPDEQGRDWDAHLWSRMDPANKIAPEERDYGDEAWENHRGQTVDPDAGWDKPSVGRFRGAMSWLGNKLTFGKFGGKDYKARQAQLASRRSIMTNAFQNQMSYFDEREYDLANPRADDHERTKQMFGRQYIGSTGNEFSAFTPFNNPRFNNAAGWIKQSKYGRAKWDRLAQGQMGKKYRLHGLLGK